jgi:hypothetical protein
MTTIGLAMRAVFFGLVIILAAADLARGEAGATRSWARRWLLVVAVTTTAFTIWLWFNHVPFPLHLDLMEGTILQHVVRAASGQPVYPEPTPGFVALAYNPLYYYLSAVAVRLFGPTLEVLRVVGIIGQAGSGIVIFLAVRRQARSVWWGLVAVGAFDMAYHVMDSYLDTAHSDAWMLCAALLGTYLIDRGKSRGANLAGVIVLALSFWFKQHGALFAIGGVLYLTWRDGWRAAVPYWIVAILLGPVAYAAAGQWPFGPAFHYFTWSVPRGWSRIGVDMVRRLIVFILMWYPFATLAAGATAIFDAIRPRQRLTVWDVQFVAGCASALMGALDWGSADNVFIPFGAFTIVMAVIGLARATNAVLVTRRSWTPALASIGVACVMLPLLYDPRRAIVPLDAARTAYADLVVTVRTVGAPVYAPDIGQTAGTPLFDPAEHWVALEDMGRGPGHTQADRTRAWRLLDPVVHPTGQLFVLTNIPLETETPPVSLLARYYSLDRDFGDRFAALTGTPKRFNHGYPRYLYRYTGAASDTDWVVAR